MITVHLIRHGETVWHRANRYAGSSDIELTERGLAQARALEGWSASAGLDVVATSPLQRAVHTAHVVAHAAAVELVVEPMLREVDFGRAEGMTRDEMREAFPGSLDAFLASPATTPLPGGEPGDHAADRGLLGIQHLMAEQADGAVIAVVAHTTLIRLVLCRTLGIPLDDYRRRFPRLDNATITTLELPHARSRVEELRGAGALIGYNVPTVG